MPVITGASIKEIIGEECQAQFSCSNLGLVDTIRPSSLTYVSEEDYVGSANNNDNICCVITTRNLVPLLTKQTIVTDDPVWAFWTLHNFFAGRSQSEHQVRTVISDSAMVHPTSYIAEVGVFIGDGTVIEPHVTIHSGVVIGEGCLIRSGTVCGFDGFEHKRTSKGIISARHDGTVLISDRVEIGCLNSIAKGFAWGHTEIREGTKTDSLVHIAHGVVVGKECFIAASAEISGSVCIGDRCWLGPNCSIINGITLGSQVFVGIGAVVTKSFSDGVVLAGNPAKCLRKEGGA